MKPPNLLNLRYNLFPNAKGKGRSRENTEEQLVPREKPSRGFL